MKVGIAAIHHPRAAHHQEFVARVQQAVEVMRATAGCLQADCWTTAAGAVVSTGQWASDAALSASFEAAVAAGVDFTFDDREARPREIHHLVLPASDKG